LAAAGYRASRDQHHAKAWLKKNHRDLLKG